VALQSNRLTAAFLWDTASQRYYTETPGAVPPRRYVKFEAVNAALESVVRESENRLLELAERLQRGEIGMEECYAAMRRALKDGHAASAVLGFGGWHNMSDADWGWVGSPAQNGFHHKRLRALFDDIAAGRYRSDLSDPRFKQRVKLFANAMRSAKENARLRRHKSLGYKYARRVLGIADSCEDCVTFAGQGWVEIDKLVPIGQSICGANCHCHIEYAMTLEEAGAKEESGGNLTSKVNPASNSPRQVHSDMEKIHDFLSEALPSLSSRWNQTVTILPKTEMPVAGQKHPSCAIDLQKENLEWTARKWSTMLHEALHGVEPLTKRGAYSHLKGWSEGVLENLMREIRPDLLKQLKEGAPLEDLHIRDTRHPYQPYVVALERLRGRLYVQGKDKREFYEWLFSVPLHERPNAVLKLSEQLPARQKAIFDREFSKWRQLLGDERTL
jgi:hypothetical protein